MAAIIFLKFELAITLNNNPAFMPPPGNIIAMILVIIFYIIEIPLRFILFIINWCYKKTNKSLYEREIKFDLLLKIMPKFMKRRKQELDDQILYKNCKRTWTVITNEGESECKITKYKPHLGKHYMEFDQSVSINNSVEKKKKWLLDILELSQNGLIDLQQFKQNIYIDKTWTAKYYESVKQYGGNKAPYWICAYCKEFVKESKVAIKLLGWQLKARDIEMKIVNKHSPNVCPNCYRVRLERTRIALVWEISSFWTYYLLIFPVLFSLVGILRLLQRVIHPDQMRQGMINLRKKFSNHSDSSFDNDTHEQTDWNVGDELEIQDKTSKDWKKAKILRKKGTKLGIMLLDRPSKTNEILNQSQDEIVTMSMVNVALVQNKEPDDIELDLYQDKDRMRVIISPEFCNYHYRDWQLISTVRELDDEHRELFDVDESNDIWRSLYGAKNAIEPYVLKETINDHIYALSKEDELMPSEFHHDYIGMDEIIKECGRNLWDNYFIPLSTTIFDSIQKEGKNKVPLHLLARYPFELSLVLDDLEAFWESERPDDVTTTDIILALNELKFLNCIDDEERALVVYIIYSKKDLYTNSKGGDDKSSNQLYHKFLVYLYQIQSLFQDTRKIKNMMRDVSTAIVESGVSSSVFLDQVSFLIEDVRNYVEAVPFFRSMRTETFGNDTKVQLWTIRNTLYVLYFLQHTVRHHIIDKHSNIYVTKDQILDMVFDAFKYDIIDPEGITHLIHTNQDKNDRESVVINRGSVKINNNNNNNNNINQIQFDDENEEKMRISHRLSAAHILEKQQTQMEQEEKSNKEIAKRVELFEKNQITAVNVQRELFSIFSKIQHRRQNRITDASIAYYRRHLKVKLLKNDEALKFIFEQLSRYCTFNPKEMNKEIDAKKLYQILRCTKFGGGYKIDEEMRPILVDMDNTKLLHRHLLQIFQKTKFKNNGNDRFTLNDALSIQTLYYKIFTNLIKNQQNANDRFVVSHDIFCKFMDRDYDIDSNRENWSKKTKASSDLFQSVLDSSSDFVTLGQIKQTINKLIYDIKDMECGGLIRIMNHLWKLQESASINCSQQRFEWKNIKENKVGPLPYVRSIADIEDFNDIIAKTILFGEQDPGLGFEHIDKAKWSQFIKEKSQSYGKFIVTDKLTQDKTDKDEEEEDEEEEEEEKLEIRYEEEEEDIKQEEEIGFDMVGLHQSTDLVMDELLDQALTSGVSKDDDGNVDAEMAKLELKETASSYQDLEGILRTSAFGIIKDRNNVKKKKKNKRKAEKLEEIRNDVFSTALSFNSRRITLQQWFRFARSFCKFLGGNKAIKTVMRKYLLVWNESDMNEVKRIKEELKNSSFADKKKKYFGHIENKEEYRAEINWLFHQTENLYELCHKMYPFWSGKILKEIYYFLESTEQIEGIYELKATEFVNYKYSLHVNSNSSTNELFHIIRFKIRTLSYKQFYDYFNFLLKIKYKIKKVILNSSKAEDTTVSKNGLKTILNISLNNESEWLFSKVRQLYGSRITWKQISSYLTKTIKVRDDTRDFFNDQERNKNYKKRRAELIYGISENQTILKNQLNQIQKHKNNDLSSINQLKKIFIKNAMGNKKKKKKRYQQINIKMTFLQFLTSIKELRIDIKEGNIQNIFQYLLSQQNKNARNQRKTEEIEVDFLIDLLKAKVPNYHYLEPKQILQIVFSEIYFKIKDNDNEFMNKDDKERRKSENDNILSEIMKQNNLMMDEMKKEFDNKLKEAIDEFRREINDEP